MQMKGKTTASSNPMEDFEYFSKGGKQGMLNNTPDQNLQQALRSVDTLK